ncbi:chaperone modulator CbpM [Zunongwangia sp. F363]|uniref:Chaperone modulator CbpM n=1 Tax=Autumnicola tepida TaxID=3075595 RepID=A0ABU3C6Q0_9FLAO|nr:chaperone modulator CbpM [Zunongwangia sp. F363]MDT0642023.1 chaperone modulator CbpM [Zunongwangia sp. F363]
MNLEELIPAEKICTQYQVEHTFIHSLHESGLIEVVTVEETQYVHCDHLRNFEKMMRLHRDLHINIEGLQAVQQLLEQVQQLQKQNRKLRNRLNLYE